MNATTPPRQEGHGRAKRWLVSFRARRGDQRGQSIVEVALIVPVAMLLIAGALDMGRLFYARVAIENAAREGAVFGASNPRCDTSSPIGCEDPNTAEWRARTEAAGLDGLAISFVCRHVVFGTSTHEVRDSVGDCLYGDTYEATVTDEFEFVTPILAPILGSSLMLEARATASVLTSASEPGAAFEAWAPSEPTPTPTAMPTTTPTPTPTPTPAMCTVPNLVGQKVNDAETSWHATGFSGALLRTRTGNYTVVSQSLIADSNQPCIATITAADE